MVGAHGALAAIRDPSLDEGARERAVQRASIELFGSFVSISIRSAAALLAAAAPIYAAELSRLAAADSVLRFMARWEVVLGASFAICAALLARHKLGSRR